MYKILDKVNSPKDLKKLSVTELEDLAEDVRNAVLNRVSKIGGHVGSNLGIVDATIALHYVFDFLKDKLVIDVSHQCYPHKILTERKHGFVDDEKLKSVSGYLSPEESAYDTFKIGHTSTSISLATGVAKARDLNGEKYAVVALVGDGSLSGGEAFEGLNNASVLGSNMIIVVNDNEMSIAPNQGGLYKNLQELRESEGKCKNNFFKAFGFDYIYLEEGNNIEKLIATFKSVKNTKKPVVVHIHTQKGKGVHYAETKKERWHFSAPFDIETGNLVSPKNTKNSFGAVASYLKNKAKLTKNLTVITAATPGIFGFDEEFRKDLGNQYVDVGIAEEHAVAFASGLAKAGAKPVLAFNSSFVQRTYDQLSQDLALNNSPAVVLVYRGELSGASSTHLGIFDLSMINNIPNLVCVSPSDTTELLSVLDWAIEQNEKSIIIRVPSENLEKDVKLETAEIEIGKSKVVDLKQDVVLFGLGVFLNLAKDVQKLLKEKHGIESTIVNPLFTSELDTELLNSLKENHKLAVTFENGLVDGGFGEKISRFYGDSEMKVLNFGAKKEFTDNVSLADLKERYHLTAELATEDIAELFKNI